MQMVKDGRDPIMANSDSEKLAKGIEELEGVCKFRDSVRAEADRPDFFWARQRDAIMANITKPELPKSRRALLWIPAAAALLLCMFFFAEISKTPIPDLAAGYDQALLIEVERALNRNHPDALTPALLIIKEMEQNKTVAKHP